jgi:hypothetical protein
MRKVVLAVVASKGNVSSAFAESLSNTAQKAKEQDIEIAFDAPNESVSGMSTVIQKNLICNRVLSSPSVDGVFFVHPNLSWYADDFLKLANYNGDGVIAGAYVDSIGREESYPITLKEDLNAESKNEYPLATYLTTSFIYIPKKVLQGLSQFAEHLGSEENEEKFYLFFKEGIKDNLILQEDVYFCDLLTSSGFDIFVDPSVNCTNNSPFAIRTNYKDYLAAAWVGKMAQESEDIPQN